MLALSGGPANHGHDGWLTYECSVGNGIMVNGFHRGRRGDLSDPDRGAPRSPRTAWASAEWNGAPATKGSYRSLTGDMTRLRTAATAAPSRAKGVLGGQAGAGCGTWKRASQRQGRAAAGLPQRRVRADGEAVHYRSCAGGGYGDPRRRDPERVVEDVNRQWLSVAAARKDFGVAVAKAPNGIDYVLDKSARRGCANPRVHPRRSAAESGTTTAPADCKLSCGAKAR